MMIRRGIRRERRRGKAGSTQAPHEVQRLREQVGRLEQALVEVLAASDAAIHDNGRRDHVRIDPAPGSGFAGEWADHDLKAVEAREFFSDVHLDLQARRWLLGPRKRSLRSRVRFGRTQKLRPPVLPRPQPALVVTR